MSLLAEERGSRRARRILLLLGLVVVVVVALVIGLLLGGSAQREGAKLGADDGGTQQRQRQSEAPKPGSKGSSASGIKLPAPQKMEDDGLGVGFPNSELGAVAASANHTKVLDLFAPEDEANRMVDRTFIDRDKASSRKGSKILRSTARKFMGIPETGEAPSDAYITYEPQGFISKKKSDNQYLVWLLVQRMTSKPVEEPTVSISAVGSVMEWDGKDWKETLERTGVRPEAAAPGSAKAEDLGWKDLANAEE